MFSSFKSVPQHHFVRILLSLCHHKMIADVIFLFVFGQVGQVWLVLEGSKSSRQNRYRGARAAKNDF